MTTNNILNELHSFKEHLSLTLDEILKSIDQNNTNIPDLNIELNGKSLSLPLHADLHMMLDNFISEVIKDEEDYKNIKEEKEMKVFDLLKKGNYQAKVIKPILDFKEGSDVDLMLTNNDTVIVVDLETEYQEELNLDTHEDYDKYFKIY